MNDYIRRSAVEVAETLLHGLGHVFEFVTTLGGSAIKYDRNLDGSVNWEAQNENAKKLQNCKPRLPE